MISAAEDGSNEKASGDGGRVDERDLGASAAKAEAATAGAGAPSSEPRPQSEEIELTVVEADSICAGAEDAKSMPVADVREARGDRLRFDSPLLGCRGKMPLEASCMGRCGETVCS